MSNPDSPQVQIIKSVVEGFEKRDMDHVAKYLHKDYRNIVYPRSLGEPEKTREEWLRETAMVVKLWTSLETTLHSVIETPGKVIIHITHKAKTSIGVDMYREMIVTSHIVADEDGTLKIGRIEEFVDSKSYLEFAQGVAAAKVSG